MGARWNATCWEFGWNVPEARGTRRIWGERGGKGDSDGTNFGGCWLGSLLGHKGWKGHVGKLGHDCVTHEVTRK